MVEPPLGGVASAVLDAEMTMGDSSSVSCAALNSAYTGTATLSCSDHYSRGKPVIDVSGCACDNPYGAGTDAFLCFKYKNCYSYTPIPEEELDCHYDCSAVPGFEDVPQDGHCLPLAM